MNSESNNLPVLPEEDLVGESTQILLQLAAAFVPILTIPATFLSASANLQWRKQIRQVIELHENTINSLKETQLNKESIEKATRSTLHAMLNELEQEKLELFRSAHENFLGSKNIDIDDYSEAIDIMMEISFREFKLLCMMKSAPDQVIGSLLHGTEIRHGRKTLTLGSLIYKALRIRPENLQSSLKRLERTGFYEPNINKNIGGECPGFSNFLHTLGIQEPVWQGYINDPGPQLRDHIIASIQFQIDNNGFRGKLPSKVTLKTLKELYEHMHGPGMFAAYLRDKVIEFDRSYSTLEMCAFDAEIMKTIGNSEDISSELRM